MACSSRKAMENDKNYTVVDGKRERQDTATVSQECNLRRLMCDLNFHFWNGKVVFEGGAFMSFSLQKKLKVSVGVKDVVVRRIAPKCCYGRGWRMICTLAHSITLLQELGPNFQDNPN